jgi:arabinose-5-phosphate isomerase
MGADLLSARVGDVMTRKPKTINPQTLASAALQIINDSAITALFVEEDGKPVGIIHIHDLLRIGVA